ncbi:hypothetical protein [Flavobacterium sp. I3-2]|uniref:hypothetical protein n=1 Tax=Flavobacterium sp. I3-2 TaxID=2748319 RepID=UPI0015B2E95B|nr:hypothetical protein [Flavobacterium sp. I3-2]
MKKILNLILLQGIISLISGILLSKMSLVGKIGISVVYTEYSLLKTWWKGALVVFLIQLILIAILYVSKRFALYKNFVIINLVLVILGLLGLFFTYIDFTTTSHKYMNSKFHSGGYLVWAGWFINCIYFFIFSVKPKPIENTDLNQRFN